ncbi:MAG: fumarylacetoacetate hydrolase family protein [Geminicoccaceae bacterium]
MNVEAAAQLLRLARARGDLVQDLPEDCRPRRLEEAYPIQDAIVAAEPAALAGWKVGATSREIQRLFGIDEPVYGPVFRDGVVDSPAVLDASRFRHRLVESELAFRFVHDLPPRARAWTREEVVAAVGSVAPAFELIEPRYPAFRTDDIPQLTADWCGNGGAVLGAAVTDWQRLDLPGLPVALRFDGELRQRGTGALVLGDPVAVLVWLANALQRRGQGIARGQIVLTGTMTGLHALPAGAEAVATFDGMGDVAVRFDTP